MYACMHALCSAWETCNSCVPCQTGERGRVWLVVVVEEGMKKDCWHNVASHWDWARCDGFFGVQTGPVTGDSLTGIHEGVVPTVRLGRNGLA